MTHFMQIKLIVDKILVSFLSFLLFTMLFCVCWQVFSRYILKSPAVFTEELVRFVLMWVGLLGSAYAFGTHKHLSLKLVYDKFPIKIQRILSVVTIIILCFISSCLFIYGGFRLMAVASIQKSSVLAIPMNMIYSVLPISGILILFYQIYDLITFFTTKGEQA